MRKPLQSNNYILHRESNTGVRQWHFTRVQVLSLSIVTTIVLAGFLFISGDFLSKYLYEKRLDEFKSNYKTVAANLEVLRARLDQINAQMVEIEKRIRRTDLAGMPEIDQDIRKLGIGGYSLEINCWRITLRQL